MFAFQKLTLDQGLLVFINLPVSALFNDPHLYVDNSLQVLSRMGSMTRRSLGPARAVEPSFNAVVTSILKTSRFRSQHEQENFEVLELYLN